MKRQLGGDSENTERLPLARVRAAADDQDLRATLTVLKGPEVGTVYPIEEGVSLIGRSVDAEVQVTADGVSRRHALIEASGGKYVLSDLGSTNGTICRGTLLDEPMVLSDGDRINLGGRVILRFAREGALEEALREHVYTLATRDALTRAYNRRYFHERLSSEWAWAVRHANTCALLMLDVDHFKAINDTYGHPAGDIVLRGIVEVLVQALRREDLIARVGGEEFAVLCRATDLRSAAGLAERLRRQVETTTFKHKDDSIRATISVGIGASTEPGVNAPSVLIERADENLYRAKQGGRNRVEPVPRTSWIPL
jgi:two-component system cell cycle response regulator